MKVSLIIASLISLAIGLWAGWNELNYVLLIGFLAFAALLFMAHIDQIEIFRATGSGIEAKTRAVIKEAENTITELQSLARIFAGTLLSSVKRAGRLGGYEDDEQEEIKKSVLSVLKEIGIPESENVQILSDWHRFVEFDYNIAILGGNTIPQGFDEQPIHAEWSVLRDFKNIATPNQLKEFLDKWGLLDEAHSGYIKDYDHYINTRQHRRLEVWKQKESWGVLRKP